MSCGCRHLDIAAAPSKLTTDVPVIRQAGLGGMKAYTDVKTGKIFVDDALWNRLSSVERRAIVAHELAHNEAPADRCEPCMDERAGAILRHEGVSLAAAADALRVVSSRPTADRLVKGWRAADAAIRGNA